MAAFWIFILLLIVNVSTQHSVHPRIINGKDAPPDRFSFIASIQVGYPPLIAYFHVCTGTVLDEFWILSTAVCIKRISQKYIGKTRVKIGMFFTRMPDDSVQSIKIAVKITHEKFNGSMNLWANDIGLIKLKTPISNPQPAKLSQPGDNPTGQAFIMGWGRNVGGKKPKVLQYALVFILNNLDCVSLLSKVRGYLKIQDSQICTHSPTSFVSGSDGDAGAPVVRYVNEEPEIVGLLSWTVYPYEKRGTPTVNTRISEFIEWILEKTKKTANEEPENEDLLASLLTSQSLA